MRDVTMSLCPCILATCAYIIFTVGSLSLQAEGSMESLVQLGLVAVVLRTGEATIRAVYLVTDLNQLSVDGCQQLLLFLFYGLDPPAFPSNLLQMVKVVSWDWRSVLTTENTSLECVWFLPAVFSYNLCAALFEIIKGLEDDPISPNMLCDFVVVPAVGHHFLGGGQVNTINVRAPVEINQKVTMVLTAKIVLT